MERSNKEKKTARLKYPNAENQKIIKNVKKLEIHVTTVNIAKCQKKKNNLKKNIVTIKSGGE